ncbi:S41 family peptidase [Kordiimonas lacus]|uniref:Peptidase family S41 n=1 Tax=Kordiimonas lacus TaxID=637679 RepID=A0A1G6ZMH1_9PROT|nr:S41 family peptidase [Kordiimonas lacus]SDE03799.1 Peptidase family S41 [Kordiimonas lacus]
MRGLLFSFLIFLTFLGTAGSAADPDGVWQTEGYGYLFDVRGQEVAIYETTAISCLPSGLIPGALEHLEGEDAEARFGVTIPGFIEADMEIWPLGKDSRRFHRSDTSTFMTAHKLAALPDACKVNTAATAQDTVAVFHESFKIHYPFFAEGRTGWPAPTVDAIATDQELFDYLTGLMAPLEDAHTALVAPSLDAMYFGAEGAGRSAPEESRKAGFEIVDGSYLRSPLAPYCRGMLGYAELVRGVGYLRVSGFTNFSEANTPDANLAAFERALDDFFDPIHGLAGLVIDLRDNAGGSDALALAMARRLTEQEYIAYSKQAYRGGEGGQAWTDETATWVQASDRESFWGPVVVLTGPNSMSAAETFLMALMDRAPEVTRIGDNTRGAFADMLPRILPNGWLFALPNERYLDSAGKSYDRLGIPPHIRVPVFSEEDLAAGRDSALDAALKVLTSDAR